jgi:ABC-type multidrug transport system fused ATPase/permease subunit
MSKRLHNTLVGDLLSASVNEFHAHNLPGTILNRLSKDINSADNTIPANLYSVWSNLSASFSVIIVFIDLFFT